MSVIPKKLSVPPHSVPAIHQYSSALGFRKALSELSFKAGEELGDPFVTTFYPISGGPAYTPDLVHPASDSLQYNAFF